MKRFQFRLDTLLKFRKMQKEEAQLKFAQAANQAKIEKEQLSQLEDILQKNIGVFKISQSQVLTVDKLKSFHNYFDKIREDIKKQLGRLNEAELLRLECLKALESAVKNYEVVENLRAKRLLQHQAELLSEEQKFLDELGLQNYVRKS